MHIQLIRRLSQKTQPAILLILTLGVAMAANVAKATPFSIDLNRSLQIGWYALRVSNLFGTNYTGLVAIKDYNKQTQTFTFINQQGQEVPINAREISFIYFRQLPDRADVNVKTGDIRNIQITPYREFLYNIPPNRLVIQDGILQMDSQWAMAEQKPFGVSTATPPLEGGTLEKIQIPRIIQLNYLGNRYLVQTELVNMITRTTSLPGAGSVPLRQPTLFPVPAPIYAIPRGN